MHYKHSFRMSTLPKVGERFRFQKQHLGHDLGILGYSYDLARDIVFTLCQWLIHMSLPNVNCFFCNDINEFSLENGQKIQWKSFYLMQVKLIRVRRGGGTRPPRQSAKIGFCLLCDTTLLLSHFIQMCQPSSRIIMFQ